MPEIKYLRARDGRYTSGGNACRWIVVHNTGCEGSAERIATSLHDNFAYSSFHYALDDTDIYQCLDDTDTAWAVGAWKGYAQIVGNDESISIEVCSNDVPFTDAEISNLRWLVRKLMAEHGIDANHVVRHWDCMTGRKRCPYAYSNDDSAYDSRWEVLHEEITREDALPTDDMEIWTLNGGDNQLFRFGEPDEDGYRTVICKRYGKVIDAKGASASEGTPLIEYRSNGGDNQKWLPEKVTVGESTLYVFSSRMDSSLVWDCYGGSRQPGTKFELWTRNGGMNQMFAIVPCDEKWFYLVNAGSCLVMDVAGGGTAD